jgi:aconitate hydratase 2/2-methylisocitrate dehydratase
LTCPNRCWCAFHGELQPGITLRDVVNAIPYVAIQKGLLTVAKQNKKNVFNGRIMEIEGLPDLKWSRPSSSPTPPPSAPAPACTIALSEETVAEYLRSNVALLRT